MINQRPMVEVVNENFERYAGNVILDRAICDVRDMLKPSARMLIYSQMSITKNTHKKPFIKSARVVGDCLGHLYEHGESSCYSSYMRMSKDFTMRVPLEECQGNNGTMTKNGDEASMRYTELRLSEIASYLYSGLDKNAIGDNWRNNFDETEQYPGVMPSIGYFNLCNGTQGLGIAISSSIPQFSLREVNEAIIKLIQNPDAPDEKIIIMPDFATGGNLINSKEVFESLKNGTGSACKLRATLTYNPDLNIILITELPYGVYSEVIKKQVRELMLDDAYGIKSIHDNTGKTPEIEIELNKGVNPKRMIAKLFKDTSLENHFTINMWVLKDGRFPQIMGLRQIFQEYITHIRQCKRNEIQFDLDKALARKNIVDGLIRACSIMDEIVTLIRSSNSPSEAKERLIKTYSFNEEQAKAILAMKLSSLTKLDVKQLTDEAEELTRKIAELTHLLNDSIALDNELIKILREVAEKFGDARRTKILNIIDSDEEVENTEEKELAVMLFDNNMIRLLDKDEMQGAKKGRKGINIKPPKGANLIKTLYSSNLGLISAFTNCGRMYNFSLTDLEVNKDYSIYEVIQLQENERVVLLIDSTSFNSYQYLLTVSKKGYVKKTNINEYASRARKGIAAVKLENDDVLIGVYLAMGNDDKIFIVSSTGNYNFYPLAEVSSTGRVTRGVKAIKLQPSESVQTATVIKKDLDYHGILTIDTQGRGKITPLEDFSETSRAVKGIQVMNLKEAQIALVHAIPSNQTQLFLMVNNKSVLCSVEAIPTQSRTTIGNRLIDAREATTKIELL